MRFKIVSVIFNFGREDNYTMWLTFSAVAFGEWGFLMYFDNYLITLLSSFLWCCVVYTVQYSNTSHENSIQYVLRHGSFSM